MIDVISIRQRDIYKQFHYLLILVLQTIIKMWNTVRNTMEKLRNKRKRAEEEEKDISPDDKKYPSSPMRENPSNGPDIWEKVA